MALSRSANRWLLCALVLVFAFACSATWILKGPCVPRRSLVWGPGPDARLCLTSTPARLRDPWIVENILRMTTLKGHYGVVLALPHAFARTGEPYEVPASLERAEGITLLRCEDEGPGTKLLAPLRDDTLGSGTILMVCDDDMRYKAETFLHLATAIGRDPTAVHCMCQDEIRGYMGFGSYKSTLMPLLRAGLPEVCLTVDDDAFTATCKSLGILMRKVSIPGCMSICQACAYDVPTGLKRVFSDKTSLVAEEVFTSTKRRKKATACRDAVVSADDA